MNRFGVVFAPSPTSLPLAAGGLGGGFTNATQRWQNHAPSIVANNSVESLLAPGFVGRSRDPQWKLQPLWMKGWQAVASRAVESFLNVVLPTLSDPDIALLKSLGGPLASAPFVSFPTSRATRLEPQVSKVLILRRLRLPLPLTARVCRCGRLLDVFGHHRSACAVAGLGRRGFPLETAAARICREFAQTLGRGQPVRHQEAQGGGGWVASFPRSSSCSGHDARVSADPNR